MASQQLNWDLENLPEEDKYSSEIIKNKDEFLKLPSTLIEAYNAVHTDKYHQGTFMSQKSIEVGRACNEAIVFMYGCSGAGKTETLNNLFDLNFIPVRSESQRSDTSSVAEYVATMDSETWEVKGLEIGFIDIPGCNDTKGIGEDAINLSMIEKFIATHPHLGSKVYKCYPNIILVVVNVAEEKIEGKLVTMLKSLVKLNIIDCKHPNIIIVLTHIMTFPAKFFDSRLSEMAEFVKKIAMKNLRLDVPIVYLENKPEDYDLQKVGDMYLIPNKDKSLQPKNLFDELINQMNSYEDEIGIEAIRLFFALRGVNKPTLRFVVSRDAINQRDIDRWKGIIIQRINKVSNDEVTAAIQTYEKNHPLIEKGALLELTIAINKSHITKKEDFNGQSIFSIDRKLRHFHTMNGKEKSILIDLFKVEPTQYPTLVNRLCRCYSVGEDTYLPVMITSEPEKYIAQGALIPKNLEISFIDECQVECAEITDSNISGIAVAKQAKANRTNNILFKFTITQSVVVITLRIDEELEKLITKEFRQDVTALNPQPSNEKVKQFAEKYGHYLSAQSTGGGVIEGRVQLHSLTMSLLQYSLMIRNHISLYLTALPKESELQGEPSHLLATLQANEIFNLVNTSQIQFLGGIAPQNCHSLSQLTKEKFSDWVHSLTGSPNVLPKSCPTDEMYPIHQILSIINQRVTAKLLHQTYTQLYPAYKLSQEDPIIKTGSRIWNALECLDKGSINNESSKYNYLESDIEHFSPFDGENKEGIDKAKVAASARSRRLNQAIFGFPEKATIIRRKLSSGTGEEIEAKDVMQGDHVLCLASGFQLLYVPVKSVRVERRELTYKVIEYSNGTLKIGYDHLIMTGNEQNMKKANDIKVNEMIYKVDLDRNTIDTCRVIKISHQKDHGNIQIIIETPSSISNNILVNRIACSAEKGCFPGNSKVTLKGGDQIPISQLQLGQSVLSVDMKTNKLLYTKVYLWAHRQPHTVATFLRIVYQGGAAITLTHNHLLPTNTAADEHCTRPKMLPASQLKVGDIIYTTTATSSNMCTTPVRVLSISTCTQTGYYAPLTTNSVIVVDGVVASVFSLPASPNSSLLAEEGKLTKHLSLHTVAHHLFTPLRVASKFGLSNSLNKYIDAETGIHKYCNALLEILKNCNSNIVKNM